MVRETGAGVQAARRAKGAGRTGIRAAGQRTGGLGVRSEKGPREAWQAAFAAPGEHRPRRPPPRPPGRSPGRPASARRPPSARRRVAAPHRRAPRGHHGEAAADGGRRQGGVGCRYPRAGGEIPGRADHPATAMLAPASRRRAGASPGGGAPGEHRGQRNQNGASMSSIHAGTGPAQRGQTWPQPSMYTDSATVVSAPQPGFAQVMVAEGRWWWRPCRAPFRWWFPVAGSWFVVCSGAGREAQA